MPANFTMSVDTRGVERAINAMPWASEKARRHVAARLFDMAQDTLDTATDMTPHRTGRLTASILQYGIKDSKGRPAKRGISSQLMIGATVPYAPWMHDGFRGGPYFLGIGRQTKTDRRKKKRKKSAFTVIRADGSGVDRRMGFQLKGSMAKYLKTGVVGWKFLTRALDKHRASLNDWPDLAPTFRKAMEEKMRSGG